MSEIILTGRKTKQERNTNTKDKIKYNMKQAESY